MSMEPSLVISCLALIISAITAWLTWFHRGTIKMTRPAIVFFGPDDKGQSKVGDLDSWFSLNDKVCTTAVDDTLRVGGLDVGEPIVPGTLALQLMGAGF